jgi:hypothetical protein
MRHFWPITLLGLLACFARSIFAIFIAARRHESAHCLRAPGYGKE